MRYLIPLLFPLFLFAETTDNLLNQTYFNGTTPINGWSGTNDHNHGGSIIAGVHGEYLENTITLGDTLNQSQMNGGWTSTFGSDIWHWNDYQSTVRMTQTITGADGSVTTQVRDVVSSPCGGSNCGSYVTYTDSYTQGINNQSNFDIKVRYDFSDTSQSSSHWSPDIKNPTLIIEHSLLSVEQQSTILEINETIDETIQQQVETIEFIPEQEFTFEITEQPIIEMSMVEEFNFEPQAIEELNAGVVDVFQEIPYDNQTTFEEVATEIKVEEVFVETRESFNETKVEEFAEEIISEEITAEAPIEEATPEPMEQTESNVSESKTETTVASEEVNEVNGEGETGRSESGNGGAETVTQGEETLEGRDTEVEEGRVEGNTRVSTQTISIESIEKKVNETLKRVDQRLVATSLIIAKAMESNISLDNYGQTNNNIFNNQLFIDGGNYYDQREYVDLRDIYAENQNVYNDSVAQHQTNIQKSIDEVIRTQEHLRRIRGY